MSTLIKLLKIYFFLSKEKELLLKHEYFILFSNNADPKEPPLSPEEKERLLRLGEEDREDYGWGDPYEDLYDDDSFEEGEEFPEDQRPSEPPRLQNPPRLSLSERIALYFKTKQGKEMLPFDEARDFGDKIKRRDKLNSIQGQRMEAHMEKYAGQGKKFLAEQKELKKRNQWPEEYEALDEITNNLENLRKQKLSLENSMKTRHETALQQLYQQRDQVRYYQLSKYDFAEVLEDRITKATVEGATLDELLELKQQLEMRLKLEAELRRLYAEIEKTRDLKEFNDRPGISKQQKLALKRLDKQIIEMEKKKTTLEVEFEQKKAQFRRTKAQMELQNDLRRKNKKE